MSTFALSRNIIIYMSLGAMVMGCTPTLSTLPGIFEYRFSSPKSGHQASRDRIKYIETILRGPRCQSPASASHKIVCSQYAMEAGLLYALIERQEIESRNLLREAYNFHQNCDLRVLRAVTLAKQAQYRSELDDAGDKLAGEGEPCDSTVARYYMAKLNILSDKDDKVAAGRNQLAELSSYSLGNSGISLEDVYDLRTYSFLSTSEFDQAEHLLIEAYAEGITVSPKLQALVLIGSESGRSINMSAQDMSEAKQYIGRRLEEYDFGRTMDSLTKQISEIETVKVIPWEELESRIGPKQDPNLTPTQRAVLRAGYRDEFNRIRDNFEQLNKEKEVIDAYGGGLAKAEQTLVTAAVAAVFGERGDNSQEMQEAREAYLAAFGNLKHSLERIHSIAVGEMTTNFKDYHPFLEEEDQRVAMDMTTAIQEIMETVAIITVHNADTVVLRNFAMSVSRSLSPDEFFRAYEVSLDLLGWESEKVVENVRKVMELSRSDA